MPRRVVENQSLPRVRLGLSQGDMALYLGCSASQLSDHERQRATLPTTQLLLLLDLSTVVRRLGPLPAPGPAAHDPDGHLLLPPLPGEDAAPTQFMSPPESAPLWVKGRYFSCWSLLLRRRQELATLRRRAEAASLRQVVLPALTLLPDNTGPADPTVRRREWITRYLSMAQTELTVFGEDAQRQVALRLRVLRYELALLAQLAGG